MMNVPTYVLVDAGDIAAAKHDFSYSVVDSFDDPSIASLIEESQDADTLSMPSIVKERTEEMSITTTEDEYEDDDSMSETSINDERNNQSVLSFCGLAYTELPSAPQELSYNVTDITCPMCYLTADGGEAIVLPGCHHAICFSCFQDHVRVSRTPSLPLCCPLRSTPACLKKIDQSLVEQIEAMELIEEEQDEEENYHRCPTVGCRNVVYWKEGNGPPIGDCFQCNTTSCLKCGAIPYHSHKTCLEYLKSRNQPVLVNPNVIAEEREENSTRRNSF